MASIFDKDPNGLPPRPSDTAEPADRSKKRRELTPAELASGKRTLMQMCDEAFETLRTAMRCADYSTAVKAAQILLDRSGFGPKTTVDVNTTSFDLTNLTDRELYERAEKLTAQLRGKVMGAGQAAPVTAPMPDRVQ